MREDRTRLANRRDPGTKSGRSKANSGTITSPAPSPVEAWSVAPRVIARKARVNSWGERIIYCYLFD
jgi:hypothetical protein